jgi:hypothetical protein
MHAKKQYHCMEQSCPDVFQQYQCFRVFDPLKIIHFCTGMLYILSKLVHICRMKNAVFGLFLSLIFGTACTSQVAQKDDPGAGSLYPFNGHYVNLDNLKVINGGYKSSHDFKTNSKYACRLSFPFWFESYPKTAIYKEYKFELTDAGPVNISRIADGKTINTIRPKNDAQPDFASVQSFLFATQDGVAIVKKAEGRAGYTVNKYDENGHEVFSVNFAHTHIDAGVYSQTYYPYLDYFEHTGREIVFTSYDKRYPRTELVDLTAGKLISYDYAVNGIIRDANEEEITGYIMIDEDKKIIKVRYHASEWTTGMDNNYYDRAETLVVDSTLLLATWPNIATGSALAAYNINNGKLLWKADVRQLNAAHSQYFNAVNLSCYKDKVIMEGREAAGNYLQIFNLRNGKRLYTESL